MINGTNLPNIDKNEINTSIDEMERELDQGKGIYEKHLIKLFEKIKEVKPATIFFLDRSARPVAWMLKEMWRSLQQSGVLKDDDKLPEIRFISLDDKHPPSEKALLEGQKRYSFDRSKPVLIVDEFSESFKGKRGVDFAKKIIEKSWGANDVETHVFMDRMELGGAIPMLYKIRDSIKGQLYGIEDTTEESIMSKHKPRHPELNEKVKKYRSLFQNFGKQAGKDYSESKK